MYQVRIRAQQTIEQLSQGRDDSPNLDQLALQALDSNQGFAGWVKE